MIRPHCIISTESVLSRVGVWGKPSPGWWRVHRRATGLQQQLRPVHRFGQLQSRELLFQQKQILSCSHQNTRCHFQSYCPRHLPQEKYTYLKVNTKTSLFFTQWKQRWEIINYICYVFYFLKWKGSGHTLKFVLMIFITAAKRYWAVIRIRWFIAR